MPVFRIQAADGRTRTVTAGRAVVVGDEVRFESSNGDAWTAVAVARAAEVRAVQRRVAEADGRLSFHADAARAGRPVALTRVVAA